MKRIATVLLDVLELPFLILVVVSGLFMSLLEILKKAVNK